MPSGKQNRGSELKVAGPKGLEKLKAVGLQQLEEIKRRVVERNLEALDAAVAWSELDPENPDDVPEKWILQYGIDKAIVRHRIAKAALLRPTEIPFGLKMSADLASAAVKAASEKSAAPQSFVINAKQVQVVMPSRELTERFPSIELQDKDDE